MSNFVQQGKQRNTQLDKKSGLTIALAGNPNSGKSTMFNALTGARQHVGNYPGVTVEKKQGFCTHKGRRIEIVDLPGTYSLTAYSSEELVARNFLIEDNPGVVINILDASNLERNLYLAVQIMELGVPVVLAMNMSDIARQRGIEFDIEQISRLMGVPVIPTVANSSEGKQQLLDAALEMADSAQSPAPLHIDYGSEIETEIAKLQKLISTNSVLADKSNTRWLAIKLLEADSDLREKINDNELFAQAEKSARHIESISGDNVEALIADRRYGFIAGICRETVKSTAQSRQTASDRIDSVITNRALGLPIFLGLMYAVFQITFTLGDPFMGWIEGGFEWLAAAVSGLWANPDDSILHSLIVDGIIGGVGGVLVFLPNILLLFLAIAILEDSGYMARAAFLMDRLMNKIGLHGKSFVPMLIGFGCSVPAIMATRTLENRRDRLVTMLVVPLMSCGARLPIYALLIPAFFAEKWHGTMLWLIYIIGIVLAIISAKLLKMTVLKGETPPFVMELPPYRVPTLKGISLHMINRGGAYLKKAGTIILGIAILLWAMQQWPGLPEQKTQAFAQQRTAITSTAGLSDETIEEKLAEIDHAEAEAALESSLMGKVGYALEPVLKPCGFDWKISTAMIGAFAAKEVFVAQMGIVYSLGEQDEESEPLRAKLASAYTPLQGFCIMLFSLISAPCMATIAVTKREANSWKWALFQLVGLTVLAWIVTTAVYQIGSLLS